MVFEAANRSRQRRRRTGDLEIAKSRTTWTR